jgi:hypothetical protein
MNTNVNIKRRMKIASILGTSVFGVLIFGVLLFAYRPEARAVMTALSTDELARQSDVVITGGVASVSAFWTSGRQSIVTKAVVNVTEVVRGATPKVVVVVECDGGEADGIVVGVSDAPRFAAGEKVLLFLKASKSKHDGSDVYVVAGGAQGKYVINGGVAIKGGFSAAGDTSAIDNNLPAAQLVDKIKGVK